MAFYTCTKENPWTPEKGTPVVHVDAYEKGEQEDGYPSGDIVTKHCPNCGHTWKVELPQ